MLSTLVQLPVHTTMGLLPQEYLQWELSMSRAGAASAAYELHTLTVAQVAETTRGKPPENYLPFPIAKRGSDGRIKATQNVYVHYGNVDTGA